MLRSDSFIYKNRQEGLKLAVLSLLVPRLALFKSSCNCPSDKLFFRWPKYYYELLPNKVVIWKSYAFDGYDCKFHEFAVILTLCSGVFYRMYMQVVFVHTDLSMLSPVLAILNNDCRSPSDILIFQWLMFLEGIIYLYELSFWDILNTDWIFGATQVVYFSIWSKVEKYYILASIFFVGLRRYLSYICFYDNLFIWNYIKLNWAASLFLGCVFLERATGIYLKLCLISSAPAFNLSPIRTEERHLGIFCKHLTGQLVILAYIFLLLPFCVQPERSSFQNYHLLFWWPYHSFLAWIQGMIPYKIGQISCVLFLQVIRFEKSKVLVDLPFFPYVAMFVFDISSLFCLVYFL